MSQHKPEAMRLSSYLLDTTLACLFSRLITHGRQSVDKGNEYYERKYREQPIRAPAKRAQRLGVHLVIPRLAEGFPERSWKTG